MRSVPLSSSGRARVSRSRAASLRIAALVLLLAMPGASRAATELGQIPIRTAPGDQWTVGIASDGANGAFIAWLDTSDGPRYLYVQRLLASGEFAPGWLADGLPVCTISEVSQVAICADGAGGAFLAWEDSRYVQEPGVPGDGSSIYAQHVLASGELDPGWPAGGLCLAQSHGHWWYCQYPTIACTGAGRAVVSWMFYGGTGGGGSVHGCILTTSGAGAYFGIPGYGYFPEVVPDGAGGGIIVLTTLVGEGFDRTLVAWHVLASGEVDSAWPAGGTRLSVATTWVIDPPAQAISDGEGGVIAAWADDRSGAADVFAQRVGADGTVMWDTAGVRVCSATGARERPDLAPDGSNGAFVVWQDARSGATDIYARRVAGSGQPQGPPGGVVVCDVAGQQTWPVITSDGAGGAILAWQDGRRTLDADIFGQRLSPWGDPMCTADGEPLSAALHDQKYPCIVSAGIGGAIVAWDDNRSGTDQDVYARVIRDGPTPVTASLVSAGFAEGAVRLRWHLAGEGAVTLDRMTESGPWLAVVSLVPDGTGDVTYADTEVRPGQRYGYRLDLGAGSATPEVWVEVPASALALLGTRPNPVVGRLAVAFSLPDAGPSRLELFDLGGRLRDAREIGGLGPGEHVVTLAEGASLPPGVYLIRLTHAQRTLTARTVVMR